MLDGCTIYRLLLVYFCLIPNISLLCFCAYVSHLLAVVYDTDIHTGIRVGAYQMRSAELCALEIGQHGSLTKDDCKKTGDSGGWGEGHKYQQQTMNKVIGAHDITKNRKKFRCKG